MMENFSFHLPVKIIFGCGSINELHSIISSHFSKILIVSENNIAEKSKSVDFVHKQLAGRKVFKFLNVEENPSFETIELGKDVAVKNGVQLIVGVGGGSPMDAAKGIAIAAANDDTLQDLIQKEKLPNDPLPVICIPTTSGTGSEVTPYAVFTDRKSQNKCGYANPKIFPQVAIIDPELTYSMPVQVVVNTGLDVLTHSIEAFLSTESFPMNDLIAVDSIKLVLSHLGKAAKKDKEAMNVMAYASMLGGIAITHGGTILLHIMAYPLTIYHGIPHGKANAVLLPAVMSFLRTNSFVKDKIKFLDDLFLEFGGIEQYVNDLGVSTRLAYYGVNKNEIKTFIDKVIVKGDIKITPAKVAEKEIFEIYSSAM